MEHFEKFITEKYNMKIVFGTHSMPQKYYISHQNMKTWNIPFLQKAISLTINDEATRLKYD
ncbi:MAG: hypothetical protein ACUVQP_05255 [Bacteroidales bacterium]